MTLKLRTKVNFPATVTATGGLAVAKQNGVWTVKPDWSYLTLETTIPNAADRQLWTFDPVNDSYYRLSVQALIDNLPAGPPGPSGAAGAGYKATSTSSQTIGNSGTKTFTVQTGLAYSAGARVRASDSSNPSTNWMEGVVSSYSGGTLSFTADLSAGSGTLTSWNINLAGAKGTDGSGTGDFSSNTSSSVDGEVVLFSGTGGKTGKRATGSGLAKLTSGVLGTATSGTDYAPATSGTAVLKGNGSGGFSSASSGSDYAPATSGTAILKGNGSGGFSNASAGTDYQAADAQLFSNIPQNSQSAAYTLVLSDAQKHIFHPSSDNNARTFTIPANSSVAYPVGTALTFVNKINTVTIAINTDTLTLAGPGSTGSRTLAANGLATAIKIASTEWMISGTGLA